jgi:hypothetical protein
LDPILESPVGDVLELGSVEGLRDASTEMVSMVVQGDLLRSVMAFPMYPDKVLPL